MVSNRKVKVTEQNSLKTIYSRITAFGGSISILEEVGVSTRDMSGDLRNVEDILEDLAGKWDGLSNEMQQQIGLQLAGRFQLSRFLTLMQQWDQAQEATTTAINSTGSAMRENEAYLESMEAKLNQMRTALVSAFLEMGESFANEAILTFAETFTKAFTAVGNFINRFGALPTLFAATTPLILLMNRGIWGFITGAGKATTASGALAVAKTKLATTQVLLNRGFLASRGYMAAATAGMVAKTVAVKALNVAARVFLTTLRGIMAATGVGLVIMGAGYALDFLIGKFFGARSEADQFNEALERINSTYEQSRGDINRLAEDYEELSNAMAVRELNNEEHERYVETQNQLAQLLPHLAMGEDEHGNAILRKSDFVREEIDLLEEKLRLEREQRALEAMAGMEDTQNDIADTEAELEGLRRRLELNRENAEQYEEGSKQREEIDRVYREGLVKEAELRSQLHMLEMEQNQMMLDFYGDRHNLMEEDLEYFNRLIEAGELQLHTIQDLAGQVDEYRQLVGDAFTAEEIMAFTEEQREALDAVSDAMGDQRANLEELEQGLIDAGFSYAVVEEALDRVSNSVEVLNQKLEVDIFRDLEGSIPVETIGDLNDALEENIPLYEMVDGNMRRMTDESIEQAMAVGELTDEIDENTDHLFANFDATESLYNMTGEKIDLIYDAIEAYQILSEAEHLNTEQTAILEEAKGFLAEMFPHLVEGSSMNIEAMIAESEMMAGLGEASVAYANGRLSSEETLTLEAIKASKARIRQMQLEIDNLNILRQEMLGMIRELETVAQETGAVHYSGGRALREVANQATTRSIKLQEEIGNERLNMVGHWEGSTLQSNFSPSNRFNPDGGGSSGSGGSSGGSSGRGSSGRGSSGSSGGSSGRGSSGSEQAKEEDRNQKALLNTLIKIKNTRAAIADNQMKQLSRAEDLAAHEGDYEKLIEITNKKLENRKQKIEDIREANKNISQLAQEIRDNSDFSNTDSWFDMDNEESLQFKLKYNEASKEEQEIMQETFDALQTLKNAYGENQEAIWEAERRIRELTDSNEDLNMTMLDSVRGKYSDKLEDQQRIIDLSTAKMRNLEEGTEEYKRETELVAGALEQQIQIERALQQALMDKLQYLDLTNQQMREFNRLINESKVSVEGYKNEIRNLGSGSSSSSSGSNSEQNEPNFYRSHDGFMNEIRERQVISDKVLEYFENEKAFYEAMGNNVRVDQLRDAIEVRNDIILEDIDKSLEELEERREWLLSNDSDIRRENRDSGFGRMPTFTEKEVRSWMTAYGNPTQEYFDVLNRQQSDFAQRGIETLFQEYSEILEEQRNLEEQKRQLDRERRLAEKELRDSEIEKTKEANESLAKVIEVMRSNIRNLDEDSDEYKDTIRLISELIHQQVREEKNLIKTLEEKYKQEGLVASQRKEITQQIMDATLRLAEYEDQLDSVNQELMSGIVSTLKEMKSIQIDNMTNQFERLNETLKDMVNIDHFFDRDQFNHDIDMIVADLDRLDGKFKANAANNLSTSFTRQMADEIEVEVDRVLNNAESLMNRFKSSNLEREERNLRDQIKYQNELNESISQIDDQIRQMELNSKRTEDALQNEIDKKQEQIDLLDEEYEKEERLKRIRDIEREISEAKDDKRFSYITEEGEEILTFNQSQVSELEKQRDEMLDQYEREDIRSAMQDEVSRMQDKLSRTREVNQSEIQMLRLHKDYMMTIYNELNSSTDNKLTRFEELQREKLEEIEDRWEHMFEFVGENAMEFEDFMKGFYHENLRGLDKYGVDLSKAIDKIERQYNRLNRAGNMVSIDSPVRNDSSSSLQTGGTVERTTVGGSGRTMHQIASDNVRTATLTPLERYHSGGIVGSRTPSRLTEIFNRLANASPNEQVVKALNNELMIPQNNIARNLIPNLKNLAINAMNKGSQIISNDKHYHFKDVTVKADNPGEFMSGLDYYINASRR